MAGNVTHLNGYTPQDVKDKVAGVARTTATTVQTGLSRTQDVVAEGLDRAQVIIKRNQKSAAKNMKKGQKKARQIRGKVQGNAQSGWEQAQDLLVTSANVARQVLQENTKKANKNLKKAQKNLKKMQGPVQDSVQSGLAKTQDALETGLGATQAVLTKSAAKAGQNLQQVKANMKNMQETAQEQKAAKKRRKARARFMFRLGLVTGLVVILLYTPWPGDETRQRLGNYWQQVREQMQGRLQ